MNMNWIPVSERLPEEKNKYGDSYLVVVKTHGGLLPEACYRHIDMATFMPAMPADEHWPGNTCYWEFNGNEQSIPFEVTHWMPLPELPK